MRDRFHSNADGSITILATLMIGVMVVCMAFCIEAANLYVARLLNQRSADLANLAAASTASPIVDNAASPEAIATAANVVGLNGLSDATVITRSGPSPSDPRQQALFTTVTRDRPATFAGLLGSGTSNAVRAISAASLNSDGSASCLASLVGPTNLYGSARITGPACGVSATTFLYVCGAANVALAKANVGYSAGAEAPYLCDTATMAPSASAFAYRAVVTDTVAAAPAVVDAKRHMAAMRSPGWPYGSRSPQALIAIPAVARGPDRIYTAGQSATLPRDRYGGLTVSGATLRFSGSGSGDPACASPTTLSGNLILGGTSTLTFASGCYVFDGYVRVENASNATFAAEPGAALTLVFQKYIQNGTGTLTFPNATYSITGDVTNTANGTLTFGSGTKTFGAAISNGAGTLTFGDGLHAVNGGAISNGTGVMRFGSGRFSLWGGGIANTAGGSMTFGDGPFTFYGGSIASSGTLTFGNGPFSFQGGSLSLGPGSDTRFGVGDVDFYGGTISLAGDNVTFGYGGSAVTGASTVSLSGGTLSLTTRNLTARGVTFVYDGGTISWYGVGTIIATAPTSSNPRWGHQNLLVMVLGGAFNLYQANNPADTMSGLVYVPASNASIYGSQTITYPPGGCFGIVSGVLDIYQNARLSVAPCLGLTIGGSRVTPVMVQ
jgi:hypothetical protein